MDPAGPGQSGGASRSRWKGARTVRKAAGGRVAVGMGLVSYRAGRARSWLVRGDSVGAESGGVRVERSVVFRDQQAQVRGEVRAARRRGTTEQALAAGGAAALVVGSVLV